MRIRLINNRLTGMYRYLFLLVFFCILNSKLSAQFSGGNGDGFAFGIIGSSGGEIPLPITLVLFDAQDDVDRVKLIWETASETNNDYFTIEKSANGNDWVEVKTVKGLGNSTSIHFYDVFDEDPFNGLSYYHLKQTDYDGKSTFSQMKSINRGTSSEAFSVFPNPANNVLALNIKESIGTVPATIYNMYGQSIWSSVLHTSSKETIDISSLKAGWYFIRLGSSDKNNSLTCPFIKIE
jgi:hypothetical protein